MAQPTHTYKLEWAKMATPMVKHLAFVRADGEPIPFSAGQFITLNIMGPDKLVHRSYSIANAPAPDVPMELACAYVEGGIATNFLFNLKPGDTVEACGPFGLFVLKDEQPSRYILIGTGTGVTPYRSMLKELKHRMSTHNTRTELLLGVRNPSELLFGDEFAAFAEEHENFAFSACYSRHQDPALKPYEYTGHIQDQFERLNLNPAQDIIYLCGNPNMIDDAFTLLTEKGFDRKQIRREKYVFSHK